MQESYHNGLVITNYWEIIDRLHLSETAILTADEKWLRSLPVEGVAACLAYHFRQDHFCEGSLVHTSIANGCMLRIMTQLYALLPWK